VNYDVLRYLERIADALEGQDIELEKLNAQIRTIIDDTKWCRR
tara:strand:- start:269 stop:397 length:129 start_codon:yes stop_codon:yes gene_type:complete